MTRRRPCPAATRTAVGLAATGLAAVVLLAGCSGSPASSGSGPTSAGATTSTTAPSGTAPSPSGPATTAATVPARPTPPAEASADTEDGATAFAQYVVQLADWSSVAADSTVFEGLTQPGCTGCATVVAHVKDLVAHQARQRDPQAHVVVAAAEPGGGAKGYAVDVLVRQSGGPVVDAAGAVVGQNDPTDYSMRVRLSRVGDHWRVSGFDPVETNPS